MEKSIWWPMNIFELANPKRFMGFSGALLPYLWGGAAVSLAAGLYIGLFQVPLGQAMKTEQQVIVASVEILLGTPNQGSDVVRVLVKGWHDGHIAHLSGGRQALDLFDCGLKAGHGIVREERDEQDIVNALSL